MVHCPKCKSDRLTFTGHAITEGKVIIYHTGDVEWQHEEEKALFIEEVKCNACNFIGTPKEFGIEIYELVEQVKDGITLANALSTIIQEELTRKRGISLQGKYNVVVKHLRGAVGGVIELAIRFIRC